MPIQNIQTKTYLEVAFCILLVHLLNFQEKQYPWIKNYDKSNCVAHRINPPVGYERTSTKLGTFGDWLRHLPLKPGKPAVYLFNGKKKKNQKAHHAVVEIDVGSRDLQQCADAVMRLRAEYLYSIGRIDSIYFNFTSGHKAEFKDWSEGSRPVINGNNVKWTISANKDASYKSFKKYLRTVFTYAGTYSLSREMLKVQDIEDLRIGDVFVEGGFPGHAVIVVDMAAHKKTGEKLFLLAQSFMPAQEMHILKNPKNSKLNPWYPLEFGKKLRTPEWTFTKNDLRRFR